MYTEFRVAEAVEIRSLFSAFERTYEKSFRFDGESHDFWEVVCVLGGTVGITADNDVYTLGAGQLVIHKPMEFHRIRSEGGTSPHVVIFSFSADYMPTLKNRVYRMSMENAELIKEIIGKRDVVFGKNPQSENDTYIFNQKLEARLFVKKLECFLLSVLSDGMTEGIPEMSKGAENYRCAVGVLKQNLCRPLSVDEIATLCNMSPSNLKRVFSKYSGMGVIGYFNLLRVKKAKKLLFDGMSIKEVSLTLGFDNQNYFSTMFKRIDGNSPTAYKYKGDRKSDIYDKTTEE